MSQTKLVQLQRFLVLVVLVLICVALMLVIFIKYQSLQKSVKSTIKTEQNLSLASQQSEDFKQNSADNPFEIYHENIILKEQNLSEFSDQNLSPPAKLEQNTEENLSTISQNLEAKNKENLEQNFTQEQNLSILNNQNLQENSVLNHQESQENLTLNHQDLQENLTQQNLEQTQENLQNLSKNTLKIDLRKGGAKLAIIIDDMSNHKQVQSLKALNLKLIPSFFPPDKTHKNTHKLALNFDFYMVHLPLAALHYNKSEIDTLNPNDSQERIALKIASLKEKFKNLKYINNHTGSLFTSDENAMRKLYAALQKKNFIFVDSKTTENSKAQKIAKEFGKIYIQRDVFLDNEDDISAIKKQIQKAVNLAHKKGFAIAIAHPRKNTFKALAQSKNLLQSVKLVYLSEIYGE